MSYQAAMEAAGAKVHRFKEFGSYQGEWWALVTFNGQHGWVTGSYGSCSGCDAFEAEFDWDDEEQPDYPERLAKFGAEYLDAIMTQEAALAEASKNSDWDVDADEMVEFITNAALTEQKEP